MSAVTFQKAVHELVAQVERAEALRAIGEWKRPMWGIEPIDKATGGIQVGLNIIAGDTKIGKTTVAMNTILHNVAGLGYNVLLWTSEMNHVQVAAMAVSNLAQIPRTVWRDLVATEQQKQQALNIAKSVKGEFHIIRASEPKEVIGFINGPRVIDLLVVDYLQFIARSMWQYELRKAIDVVIAALMEITEVWQIPVVLVSATNAEGGTFGSRMVGYDGVATIYLSDARDADIGSRGAWVGEPVEVELKYNRFGPPAKAIVVLDRLMARISDVWEMDDE